MNRLAHPAFQRLPKRLTIGFSIWGLYNTSDGAAYDDLDRFVREHKERGFNCIRLDDGAGLMHDLDGNPRGEVDIMVNTIGRFTNQCRQFGNDVIGLGGKCDLHKHLIELFTAAKKYDVYIILSSWYFLHTYWFHPKGDAVGDEIFEIPPHERFMAFAKFHDYIITELKEKDLADRIAVVEIFNEADGLSFITGYGGGKLPDKEVAQFCREHEEALAWLQERHSDILFGFDSYTPWTDSRQIPSNMQVYDFHNYFLWGIHKNTLPGHPELLRGEVTEEDVLATREGLRPIPNDWVGMVALNGDLDETRLEELEGYLEKEITENYADYLKILEDSIGKVKSRMKEYPDIPFICGESVSYVWYKKLLWEEKSETYWDLVEEMVRKYKEIGIWGTVLRTCCGPEDPSWVMCADKIKRINEMFLD